MTCPLASITTFVVSIAAASTGDDGDFEAAFTRLVLAGVFGLFGLAYLVYARKQGRLIIGLTGVALMVYPFFVTNALVMGIIGVVLLFLPYLLKRVDIDL